VADKNDRSILLGDGTLRESDVIGERDCRILDVGDIVTLSGQSVVDALPAGAVDEAAVDEDDILCSWNNVDCCGQDIASFMLSR
jgi:hypothetical protein